MYEKPEYAVISDLFKVGYVFGQSLIRHLVTFDVIEEINRGVFFYFAVCCLQYGVTHNGSLILDSCSSACDDKNATIRSLALPSSVTQIPIGLEVGRKNLIELETCFLVAILS